MFTNARFWHFLDWQKFLLNSRFWYFFSGQSEHCKRALSLMDFDKINYNLIESTLEHILESDEYPQQGSILIFLPGKATRILIQFGQFWTNLIHFEPLYSNLIHFDQLGSSVNQFDPFSSNLNKFEQFWSSLIHLIENPEKMSMSLMWTVPYVSIKLPYFQDYKRSWHFMIKLLNTP